jgi:hypothetical protein
MRTGGLVSGLWTILLAGCGFNGAAAPADSAAPDAMIDACVSFSTEVDTCTLALGADLALHGAVVYDTARHVLTIDGVETMVAHATVPGKLGDVDALLARDVRLAGDTRLTTVGELPFAILASGTIALDAGAVIDVGHGGAAARATCERGAQPGSPGADGAGGGGGGGFGAAGGEGGRGNSDAGPEHAGGARGEKLDGEPDHLLGGCPGAAGGKGDVDGGAGGAAGGAIFLAAASSITLGAGAMITAGGGGGGGGSHAPNKGDAGGGGGGSGGMIVVEAPVVMAATGALAANGGGGGEGSAEEGGGLPGDPGGASTSRAPGGRTGVGNGGDGGPGGSADGPDGMPGIGPLPGGGGGGGGGIGFIRILSASPQLGTVSPQPG